MALAGGAGGCFSSRDGTCCSGWENMAASGVHKTSSKGCTPRGWRIVAGSTHGSGVQRTSASPRLVGENVLAAVMAHVTLPEGHGSE